ncbi:winged helix-turn-helix domain-containing protein [Erythrobacter ani]|uniref:Winged helix-turn-helix domain-containing protein n=1 Tax=Erythrobacter ani TaxID=2827235 RepID=A0ABS6SQN9_9SPHN|nr:tetratricopeptide repeat protein [Erythrobacter ani]MBV7267342.1 winged helix-turn-helix domain-containing protein [Erythrobacter ani]
MTVDLAKSRSFELGDLRVEPTLRSVTAGERTVSIEPRVMQVLVLLASRAGTPVDRDTMVEECWDGVIVGDDAIQRCIGRLRRLAAEMGGFTIQTIPKIGYRLLHDGEQDRVPKAASDSAPPSPPKLRFDQSVFRGNAVRGNEFAELLSSDTAAALSINRDIVVIASDRDSDANETADYRAKLEVRDSGKEARVHCSLIEQPSGRLVWSSMVDVGDAAALENGVPPDELVLDLAGRIGAIIVREVTQSSLAAPEAQSAWQAVVRANAAYQRIDLDNLAVAIGEGRRAVSLDPGYGAAHAALANALAAHFELGGGLNQKEAEEARSACDMALAHAPEDPTVLAWTAHALMMITRPAEGLTLAEKAVALAPSHWIANLYLARHYLHHGRPADAERALDDHARVAPLFPWKYFPILTRGLARFMQGDVEDAETLMREAALLNPIYPYTWMSLMVLSALKSNTDAMQHAASRLKQIDGEDSLGLQLARIGRSYPDPAQAEMVKNAFVTAWEA